MVGPDRHAIGGGRRHPQTVQGGSRPRPSFGERTGRGKFTIVSGLASGIDTVAHTTAIEFGGWTIGVIGTPISEVYPKKNAELQARIANEYLLSGHCSSLR